MMATIWRSWRRSPLLTTQYVLTIAVGMGAVTAVLSLLLALGYTPLPYRDPGALVAVWAKSKSGVIQAFSGPDLADYAGGSSGAFSALGGIWLDPEYLLGPNGAQPIRFVAVAREAFRSLGVEIALGRGVRADEPPAGGGAVAAAWISSRLWRRQYGGSPSVLGRVIRLALDASGSRTSNFRIAGVLAPGATIPLPFLDASRTADIWFVAPDMSHRRRQAAGLFGLGRLRPGVSVAQARAALASVAERLGRQYSFDRDKTPVVESLQAIAQGPAQRTMGLLALGVALVFLVGCVNVAIFMVAEGERRRREIAIRTALGAGRRRLWGEAAAEKAALSVLGLVLGLFVAFWLVRGLAQLVPATGLGAPLLSAPPLNAIVLVAFAGFALAAALVWAGLLVRSAAAGDSGPILATGNGAGITGWSTGSKTLGWRAILLAGQAGAGICLLAAATLAVTTYVKMSAINLGPAPQRTFLLRAGAKNYINLSDD
ncbi:MAG: ABC transporter permease, partial [Terriglobales bacterium]